MAYEGIHVIADIEDRASPRLSTLSRGFMMLGVSILRVARYAGVESKGLEQTMGIIMSVGYAVRALTSAKTLLTGVTAFLTGVQVTQAAVQGSVALGTMTAARSQLPMPSRLTGVLPATSVGWPSM